MKTLVLILLFLPLTTFSQKNVSNLYVLVAEGKESISCGTEHVAWKITNKRVIMNSYHLNLNIKVTNRRVGEYNAWVGIDKSGLKYSVTFMEFKEGMSMLVVPIPDIGKKYVVGTVNHCGK